MKLQQSREVLSKSKYSFLHLDSPLVKSATDPSILSLLSAFLRVLRLLLLLQSLLLPRLLDAHLPRCDLLPRTIYFRQQLLIFLALLLDFPLECVLLGAIRRECAEVLPEHLEGVGVGDALIVLLFAPEAEEDCISAGLHLTKC